MFTFEAGGPVSGRSGVNEFISLWLYVVLIYWRKVAWAIHKQVWLIYYPTPSATNYPGRLRPPVYCSALICHSAPICRLARSIVPGRLRRFLRAQLANCVGRQTALNIYTYIYIWCIYIYVYIYTYLYILIITQYISIYSHYNFAHVSARY